MEGEANPDRGSSLGSYRPAATSLEPCPSVIVAGAVRERLPDAPDVRMGSEVLEDDEGPL
jgi:hypothetical protein